MLENHGESLCTSEIQIWQIEKSLRSYERLELSSNLMVSKIQRQSVGHDWRMIYATFATMEGCLLAASMKLSKRERMYRCGWSDRKRDLIVCVARNDSGNDENIKLIPFVTKNDCCNIDRWMKILLATFW